MYNRMNKNFYESHKNDIDEIWSILTIDNVVNEMLLMIEAGKPPIYAIIKHISHVWDKYIDNKSDKTNINKEIGRMISDILNRNGYYPYTRHGTIPTDHMCKKYITNTSLYSYNPPFDMYMELEKHIKRKVHKYQLVNTDDFDESSYFIDIESFKSENKKLECGLIIYNLIINNMYEETKKYSNNNKISFIGSSLSVIKTLIFDTYNMLFQSDKTYGYQNIVITADCIPVVSYSIIQRMNEYFINLSNDEEKYSKRELLLIKDVINTTNIIISKLGKHYILSTDIKDIEWGHTHSKK